jgi:hypothetical protein
MASKKVKKKAKKKPTVRKTVRVRGDKALIPASKLPPGLQPDWKCNVPHICEYLEALDYWLRNQFMPDYTALRIAVCNAEDQAFGSNGDPNKPPRFCTGSGQNEPANPPPPPVW